MHLYINIQQLLNIYSKMGTQCLKPPSKSSSFHYPAPLQPLPSKQYSNNDNNINAKVNVYRKLNMELPAVKYAQNPHLLLSIYQKMVNNGKDKNKENNEIKKWQKAVYKQQQNQISNNIFKFNIITGFFDTKHQQNQHQKQQSQQNQLTFEIHKTHTNNLLIKIPKYADQQLWKKISSEGIGQELVQKDQIMLGKYRMKLMYWVTQEQSMKLRAKIQTKVIKCDDQNTQCRVCLQFGTQQNPLIRPCKCHGTVSTIHQKCLSKWIFNNPGSFQQSMQYYNITLKPKCQLCKASLKQYIWNRIIALISTFPGYYAIFMVKAMPKEGGYRKSVHTEQGKHYVIFKFNNNTNTINNNTPANKNNNTNTIDERTIRIGNQPGCKYHLQTNDMNLDVSLTLQSDQLYIRSNSKQCSYILTNNQYLAFNQEYKLGNNLYMNLIYKG